MHTPLKTTFPLTCCLNNYQRKKAEVYGRGSSSWRRPAHLKYTVLAVEISIQSGRQVRAVTVVSLPRGASATIDLEAEILSTIEQDTPYSISTRMYWKSAGTTNHSTIKRALAGILGFDYLCIGECYHANVRILIALIDQTNTTADYESLTYTNNRISSG